MRDEKFSFINHHREGQISDFLILVESANNSPRFPFTIGCLFHTLAWHSTSLPIVTFLTSL